MSLWVGIVLSAALLLAAALLFALVRLNRQLLALRAELEGAPVAAVETPSGARIALSLIHI